IASNSRLGGVGRYFLLREAVIKRVGMRFRHQLLPANYNLSLARLRNPLRSVDAWWNMPENIEMDSGNNEAMILVTGATGHIGREVCRLLTEARRQILAVDLNQDKTQDVRACDLRSKSQVSAL